MKKRKYRFLAGIAVFMMLFMIILPALYRWRWTNWSDNIALDESYAFPPVEESSLAHIIGELEQQKSGKSGFLPIDLPHEALSWRLAMIDSAKLSIDAQYYIWHADTSGGLLIDRLLKAADRGVRVRILIDDMTAKHDKELTVIHEHPNIEIRIFNPFLHRHTLTGQLVEIVLNLGRLNHRMHNKVLVADNLVSIVGGRNIGDEYFGLSDGKLNFRDFDLLTIGPVVPEISSNFDLYWNSKLAFPPSKLRSIKTAPQDLFDLQTRLSRQVHTVEVLAAEDWLEAKDWTEEFLALKERLFWGAAQVIYDLPSLVNKEKTLTKMGRRLVEVGRNTQKEILLSSAYFVPLKEGTRSLREASERGIHIRILTNSLAANDVVAAHSGYAPYRRELLRAGIELYEFRHDAKDRSLHEHPSAKAPRVGLHTKAVIYDRNILYVGSLNLDPRAMELNTEIGVLVECPDLAETVLEMFERDLLPRNSWRLELEQEKTIVWRSEKKSIRREPAYRFWDRIANIFFHLLPIERQL